MSNRYLYIVCVVVGVLLGVVLCQLYHKPHESHTHTIENYPTSAQNVLISDSNGNLSVTSDLGLQNLTVAGDSKMTGSLTVGSISSGGSLSAGSISTGGALSGGSISTGGALSGGSISTGGALSAGNISTGGTVRATGKIYGGNGRDILAEIDEIKLSGIKFIPDFTHPNGGSTYNCSYIRYPNGTFYMKGITTPQNTSGTAWTFCTFPIQFTTLLWKNIGTCRIDNLTFNNTGFSLDSNAGSTSKCHTTWELIGKDVTNYP